MKTTLILESIISIYRLVTSSGNIIFIRMLSKVIHIYLRLKRNTLYTQMIGPYELVCIL